METIRIVVAESSQVSDARRRLVKFASELGFSESDKGTVALVATEAATNLVKHSPEGGQMLVRKLGTNEQPAIELLVLDTGPGIAHIGRALSNGFSTAGSPGTGLGAIGRLASSFDLYSLPGKGTALLVVLSPGKATASTGARVQVGGLRVAHANEQECGDAWVFGEHEGRWLAMVVDGLGHGVLASEAAELAVKTFDRNVHLSAQSLMESIHLSLRAGRGGVAAIAEGDVSGEHLNYVGVGNISGSLHNADGVKSLVSHNGTLGQDVRRFHPFSYPWTTESLLVMHSDGIQNRWDLQKYPGLISKPASLIAGVLYRDYNRGRDDASVMVVKGAAS